MTTRPLMPSQNTAATADPTLMTTVTHAQGAPMTSTTTPNPITAGNSPVSTGVSGNTPPAQNAAAQKAATPAEVSSLQSTLQSDEVTFRDRLIGWRAAFRGYWTTPSVLSEPAPAVTELAAYARHGAWTPGRFGFVRGCGIAWYRLVGLPVTVVCRYVEWIAQRPGRAIPVFAVWKLLISTGAGPWIAEHIIRPVLAVLAWAWL